MTLLHIKFKCIKEGVGKGSDIGLLFNNSCRKPWVLNYIRSFSLKSFSGTQWDLGGNQWDHGGRIVGGWCYHGGRIMGASWEDDGRIYGGSMEYPGSVVSLLAIGY